MRWLFICVWKRMNYLWYLQKLETYVYESVLYMPWRRYTRSRKCGVVIWPKDWIRTSNEGHWLSFFITWNPILWPSSVFLKTGVSTFMIYLVYVSPPSAIVHKLDLLRKRTENRRKKIYSIEKDLWLKVSSPPPNKTKIE